jgi:hypothetical protein
VSKSSDWWTAPPFSGYGKPCKKPRDHVIVNNNLTDQLYCQKCGVNKGPAGPTAKKTRKGKWGR